MAGKRAKTVKAWTSDQIKKLRESYDESQEAFSRRLGVTPTAYRYWEWGRGSPNGSALILLGRLEEDLRNGEVREMAGA